MLTIEHVILLAQLPLVVQVALFLSFLYFVMDAPLLAQRQRKKLSLAARDPIGDFADSSDAAAQGTVPILHATTLDSGVSPIEMVIAFMGDSEPVKGVLAKNFVTEDLLFNLGPCCTTAHRFGQD